MVFSSGSSRWLVVVFAAVVASVGCTGSPPVTVDAGLTCDAPTRTCAGNCVDVRVDDHHCGACDNACGADQSCAGSRCYPRACGTLTCGDRQVCVSGVCADRSCFGVVCASGSLCAAGTCRPTSCGTTPCGASTVCVDNTCIDPSCVGVACPSGAGCVNGACRFDTCTNQVRDGTETDVNCGGDCAPCGTSQLCTRAGDCKSRVCTTAGVCAAPTCTDGVRNGEEADADCGGTCGPCATGQSCTMGQQCVSGSCLQGTCKVPTCTDTVRNGTETDVDCGGAACRACGAGMACTVPSDCATAQCSTGRCISAQCSNSARDGTETDIDCGGSACAPCGPGKGCDAGTDCVSAVCGGSKTCSVGTCGDNARNGNETDVDCGGGACPACTPTKGCVLAGDCTSRVCVNKLCAAATCTDLTLNGNESDVDCGGSACGKCGTAKSCLLPGDCQSNLCAAGRCAPPPLLAAPIAFAVGAGPRMVSAGDLDLDGTPDLAVSNYGSYDVTIYFANRDGGFAPQFTAQVGGGAGVEGPSGIVSADFSGDGIPDIVTSKYFSPGAFSDQCRVSLLRGAGNRTFLASVEYDQGTAGTRNNGCGNRMVVGEFTGDTRADLWITGHISGGPNNNLISPGSVSGFLGPYTQVPNAGAYAVAIDFDRDGDTDVVTHSGSTAQVSTYRNTGTTMALVTTFGVPSGNGDIAAGRLNADTFPDLAVATNSAGRVGVAFGLGDGTFLAPVSIPVTSPLGIAIADLTGDGINDLVVGGNGLVVLRGNGDGTFQPAEIFYASTLGDVGHLAVADFNGDSKPDVACIANNQLWVVFNTRP